MKKRYVAMIILLIGLVLILLETQLLDMNKSNGDFVKAVNGRIYYLKRVDGTNSLYVSDANMTQERLVYSHSDQINPDTNESNSNILDYYYDDKANTVDFIGMHKGAWAVYHLKLEDKTLAVESQESSKASQMPKLNQTHYLSNFYNGQSISAKEGSLYLTQGDDEKEIIHFWGLYDDKFTGYQPIGFSPDGQYLLYHSKGHLTPIGTIIEGLFKDSVGQVYIYNIETGESAKYINGRYFQWLQDVH